jgi:hypothetical protein
VRQQLDSGLIVRGGVRRGFAFEDVDRGLDIATEQSP